MRRFIKQFKLKDKTITLSGIVDKFKSVDFVEKFVVDKNLDYKCVDVYDIVSRDKIDIKERKGNWVQPFYAPEEYMTFINTQFSDKTFVEEILKTKEANDEK
jgi:hypothetical protein